MAYRRKRRGPPRELKGRLKPVRVAEPKYPCYPPRREGDEYVCGRCFMRWDVREDKPYCEGDI